MDSASDLDYEEEDEEPFEPRVAAIRKKEKIEDFYDIKEQLGKGRYGTVYRCIEKDTEKVWAAKYIRALKSKDKEMARSEIDTMNELKHPKLLQCVDAFETSNRVIMVTEYISGGELFERVVDDDFDLTEREVVLYMRQVCEGVQHMHQQHFLHLDLKPENIMCVDKIGTSVKLIDFGMARKLAPDENVRVMFGTPEFVAPEVVNYERIGFPTDMWSLGVICYVLLSGLSPFMGDTDAETLNNVTAAEWDFEDEAFDDVSSDAKDFISKLLVKRKENRCTVSECLAHPWLARKSLSHRPINRLRGASLRLKGYMARRRWQKTATAVRAIGRMTALRLFSNLKKTTGQDPLASNDSTSLADLLKAKREEDAQRRAQQDPEPIDPAPAADELDIDLNDRGADEPAVGKAPDAIIVQARPLERYQTVESPPRRVIDTDTGREGDNTDGSSSTTAILNTTTASVTPDILDAEAPFSNYGSDLTSSDRTSDLAEYDRASSDLADFNSHTSDSEDMMDVMDTDNPAPREVTEAATTIQAVYRGHRARKRTYQPPAIHQDLRDCDVFEGSAARFDCRISGFPEPQVYWYKDGREIKEDRHFVIEFEGEDLCSLIVREAGTDDEGVYKCEARNAAGTAFSEAELLVEVLGRDASDADEDGAASEQSFGERPAAEEPVTADETRQQPTTLQDSRNTDGETDRQKSEEASLTSDYGASIGGKESRLTSSTRSDFDSLSGGDKSSSDWTPRSSPCTSTGVSPSSSLLELDTWYRRGRISSLESHNQPKGNTSPGKVTERISRFDDRQRGPKQTVNSARSSLRSTGVDLSSKTRPSPASSPADGEKPPYVLNVETPSWRRLVELESKRKTRSSSEPPPEFQRRRELILSRTSKPEQPKDYSSKKTSKTYATRESYEAAYSKLLKSSRVPSATEGSALSLKPQFATKISVFSGTGSNGKTDNKPAAETRPVRKIYAGREIKVKSLPKVVVSREESHLRERPIESIRVNQERSNGRISSDESLTDSERSSTSSGYPEPKKQVYRTEKTFELLGDRAALNAKKPGSVLAWKIEKFARGSPLKSPRDLEGEKQQPAMQAPVRKWSQGNDKPHRRAQSMERGLYPGQGGSSLAAKIEKFSQNKSDTQDPQLKLKAQELPVSSRRYEPSPSKLPDKKLSSPDRKVAIDKPNNLLRDKDNKLSKKTDQDLKPQDTLDPVKNATKERKGKIDIRTPVGNIERPIEVTETTAVYTPPPEKKRQISKSEPHADSSSVGSINATEVEGVTKTSSNGLRTKSSAAITAASTDKKSSLGGEPKEKTSAAKSPVSVTMKRRGVTPGGIGKLTARFENNKPAGDLARKVPARIEPVVKSRLGDKKQLFDGTAKPKTNGSSSPNYRDVLSSSSSSGKAKNVAAPSAGKPAVNLASSPVGLAGKSPSPIASRYQVKPSADEKPPAFTQRPRDQTGSEGGSIYFAVSVEGTPTPDLSWHFKGRTLRDEGRYELYTEKDVFFLEIFDVSPSDAGVYTCRLVNKVGRVSAMAELKVTEKPKPVIPKGQAPSFARRISDCQVCEGEEAVFECQVSGDPPPEITWIMDGKVVRDDPRHRLERRPDGRCTLILTDVREEDDAVYTCTAKNDLGMVSSTAELIVDFQSAPKPSQPEKIEAEKAPAKRQAEAGLPTEEPKLVPREEEKVQLKNQEENNAQNKGTSKDDTDVGGHAEPPQNYHHQPRRASLQSGTSAPKPPEFLLRPRSQHITPPEKVCFSCMVKGHPAPTVTWKKNAKVLEDEGRVEIYQEGGEHFLEIYDTVEEDAGRYTCVVTNELGRTTSSANIALRGKVTTDTTPKFTQHTTNCRTKDGGVGRFSCRVAGEPAPTIQWLFLGKEISPDDDIYEIVFDGEKATLVLPEVLPEDEGEYECIARNRAGEVSCRARLTVEIPPCDLNPPMEPIKPAVQAEPIPPPPAEKTPWAFERKTSRTEIFLQAAPSSESEEELAMPKDVPKQEERVRDSTEGTLTASPSVSEDELLQPEAEAEGHVADDEADVKPEKCPATESQIELELAPDSAPTVESKPQQEPNESPLVTSVTEEADSRPVQIESSKTETTPSSFELKLDLESESESESESEPGASLEIVEPNQVNNEVKQEIEEKEDLDKADDGLSETEVSVAASQELQSASDDKELEIVIQDIVPETESKVESKTSEEFVAPTSSDSCKPEFLQTPSDVEVMDGSPLALTVKVKGNPEPDVMWIFDNCEILEDDDFKLLHDGELHSLVIREVYPEDAGVYYCKATNSMGENQCSVKIVVKDPVCQGSPPKFVQKPRSVTVDEGSSLRITCKVEGEPEPAIAWSKDGRIITPGQRILLKKLGVGSLRVLQIPAVLATDAGAYTCTISNSSGQEKCAVSVVVHPLEEEQTDFRQLLKSRPRLQNINNNNTLNSSTDKSSPEADAQQLDFRHVLTRHVQTKVCPKFRQGLRDIRIKEGETAVFRCEVEGAPLPTVSWSVNGRDIRESKYFKMTTEGSTVKLTITEAFPEDEGEYSCHASNTAGQDKTTCDLKIISWEEEEGDDELSRARTGSKVDLDEVFTRSLTISEDDDDVDVDNPESPPHPSVAVAEASPKKAKKTPPPVPAKKTSLARMRAPSFDEPDLPLVVERGGAADDTKASADGADKRIKAPQTKPQFAQGLCDKRIVEGSAAVLECRVTGEPEPDIIWYRDGTEIADVDPKYRYEFEGEHGVSLVVNNARMSDSATYTCKAVNAAGSAESSAQLIGGVAAKIEAGPKNVEVVAGQTISISCQIAGSPHPEVTWTKHRKEVEEGERAHVEVTDTEATLVIRQAGEGDAGRYKLSVSNELGADCLEISVSVVDKPDPPAGKPTATDVGRTSLTLHWTGPSYDGGSRILGYVVEMRRADGDTRWRADSCTARTSFVADNLEPEVEYLFRISAENVHGVSEPSPVSDPVRTVVVVAAARDEKTGGESDEDTDDFIVHGDVTIRTDKEVIDLYDIKEQCGKGRFGVVYRCLEKATRKQFAAKFIKIKSSDREAVRSEIRIMNELHHPKLLQCVDAFEGPRQIVMVMDYIAGGELFERVIDDDFVLTEKDAIKFMRQICAGVHYMHQKHVLHLDLKPENVMCVDTHGCRIKLIDFGLARKFDPAKKTKVMFGTPEFVAPEVINYELIGFATDLWSIGVICYILLSGLSPFMGDTDAETLGNVTAAEWDFEDEAFDDITDEAKEFIEMLLIKEKEKRHTVEECLQDKWLNKDIKTMRATQLSTAKLKKFVARRRWQKTTTAVRAIGRMASLTMFSGLKKAAEKSGSPPCSPLLRSTLRKGLEDSGKMALSNHAEEEGGTARGPGVVAAGVGLPRSAEDKPRETTDGHSDGAASEDDNQENSDRGEPAPSNEVNGHLNGGKIDSDSSARNEPNDHTAAAAAAASPPKFTKEIVDATVFEGDCARFDCRVQGEPEPEVTWYQDDEEISESRRFLMEQDDEGACSLIVKNVCEEDDAEYTVEAVNSAGKASSVAELIVHIPGAK